MDRDASAHFATSHPDEPLFTRAAAMGFPPFLGDVASSNALNAAPYVSDLAGFRNAIEPWGGRTHLLDRLVAVRAAAEVTGARVVAMMIGGSVLDPRTTTPRDLDLLMLYEGTPNAAPALLKLRQMARRDLIDVRFVPVNRDPILFAKTISYFTILYGCSRSTGAPTRGGVIVDCRNGEQTTVKNPAPTFSVPDGGY